MEVDLDLDDDDLRPRRRDDGREGIRLLADSIKRFSEVYEMMMESCKRVQMKQLRKLKAEFLQELELQKNEIVDRANPETARIKAEGDQSFEFISHCFRTSGYFVSIYLKMPSRYPGAINQDWDAVVLRKSNPKSQELRGPKAVNQALRSGAPVQTIKKFDAGSNKKSSAAAPAVNPRKLDEGTEPAALDRVPPEVRLALQKARLEKKMSQAELGKLINEQPKVVQEYENGKAVLNQAVLAKMERVLGVKLRGKGVGK
ncbi:hypothetical protein MLD38_006612 [Melastoma candidum]|uniref:Uncharacterized protein n=1 Tax=Melastoma candidum TaxID=119954 RepID=A0ACB9RPN3_9MYRT|nr:hypothetical protein MLD38_006612 [Melastoma candidum]